MNRLLQRYRAAMLVSALLGLAASVRADVETPPAPPTAQPASSSQEPAAAPAASPAAAPAPAPAAAPAPALAAAPAPAEGAAATAQALYRVSGNQVDHNTLEGWHTWRAMACERCHGANQEGLVGPSLVADLKTLSREDFNKCVLDGRPDKGMPNFNGVASVVKNLDDLYAFLKGRSDGAIPTGNLKELQ